MQPGACLPTSTIRWGCGGMWQAPPAARPPGEPAGDGEHPERQRGCAGGAVPQATSRLDCPCLRTDHPEGAAIRGLDVVAIALVRQRHGDRASSPGLPRSDQGARGPVAPGHPGRVRRVAPSALHRGVTEARTDRVLPEVTPPKARGQIAIGWPVEAPERDLADGHKHPRPPRAGPGPAWGVEPAHRRSASGRRVATRGGPTAMSLRPRIETRKRPRPEGRGRARAHALR